MGIPYRKAWSYIDALEKRLGFPLVIRQKGGPEGGIIGSILGSSRIPASGIVRALSVVLVIAGFKLLLA